VEFRKEGNDARMKARMSSERRHGKGKINEGDDKGKRSEGDSKRRGIRLCTHSSTVSVLLGLSASPITAAPLSPILLHASLCRGVKSR
jgi:hypothetical protein